MNTIPKIQEAIRKVETIAEINAIITTVKAQQKLLRRMESAKNALKLSTGMNVIAKESDGSTVLVGIITEIKRTRAVVKSTAPATANKEYDVPLSMLVEAA